MGGELGEGREGGGSGGDRGRLRGGNGWVRTGTKAAPPLDSGSVLGLKREPSEYLLRMSGRVEV